MLEVYQPCACFVNRSLCIGGRFIRTVYLFDATCCLVETFRVRSGRFRFLPRFSESAVGMLHTRDDHSAITVTFSMMEYAAKVL